MPSAAQISSVAILIVLEISGIANAAAAGNGGSKARDAKVSEQMSTKGASNSNAQWSADPVRGWVRADERHKMHEKTTGSGATKKIDGKKTEKGKVNKGTKR